MISLPPAQLAEKRKAGRPSALRLQVPDEVISFIDGHFGYYEENLAQSSGDFILRRTDGLFAYQLAVVVDDAAMGITEVVRGADLVDSTPRQLLLYRLLDLPAPRFCHLPLLLDTDGRRLSKRNRDVGLDILQQRFRPEEIIGRLAWLAGINPSGAPRTPESLVQDFSWDKIPHQDLILPEDLFT